MSSRDLIISQLLEVFQEEGIAPPQAFDDDLILLESGLDSLGFAILVSKLEGKLGFDPFMESPEPFYPRTLGEFIAFYDGRK